MLQMITLLAKCKTPECTIWFFLYFDVFTLNLGPVHGSIDSYGDPLNTE